MFRFAHTYYLYLLLLIPVFTVFLVLFLVWRKKALALFGEMSVIGQLMPELMRHIVDHLPILFTGPELEEKIKPLLETEKIRQTLKKPWLLLSS